MSMGEYDPASEAQRHYEVIRSLSESRAFEYGKQIDHWLLTLAGGTFGFSFVVLQFTSKDIPYDNSILLYTAWVSLATTIATTLAAIESSRRSHEAFVIALDEQAKLGPVDFATRAARALSEIRAAKWVSRYHEVALAALAVGVLAFGAFLITNVERKLKMTNDKQQQSGYRVQKSMPPLGPLVDLRDRQGELGSGRDRINSSSKPLGPLIDMRIDEKTPPPEPKK